MKGVITMADNTILEPEVVKAVQAEIKKLGDNVKGNYDELRRAHEALKSVLETSEGKFDTLVKAQVQKYGEDITTRQSALDAKVAETEASVKLFNDAQEAATKRMDAFEVAMKRQMKDASLDLTSEELKNAKDFFFANMSVSIGKAGMSEDEPGAVGLHWSKMDNFKPDIELYKNYCKSFNGFIRRRDKVPVPTEELKALSVSVDPDGGYTVTPTMSNQIVKRLFELDPMRSLASVETISTNAIEWLVDYDEAGGGWEGETESGAETSTPQIFKKRIPVHVLYAKPRATQTLLEDSAINIENWLADKQANRFLRIESSSFVSGDGIGKPRGFLTYADYDTAGTDQWARIERQNIGNPITADGLIDLKFRLIEQYLQRGTWLVNRLTVADIMQLKDGAGRYIWSPGLKEDEYSTLLGLPLRMCTSMPVQAANALSVAIADWRESYMIVDRLGITVQRDPYTQKPYVEFYTRKRVGGDVINFQAIKLGSVI
jgi:HK97 family phage major capsid protein